MLRKQCQIAADPTVVEFWDGLAEIIADEILESEIRRNNRGLQKGGQSEVPIFPHGLQRKAENGRTRKDEVTPPTSEDN